MSETKPKNELRRSLSLGGAPKNTMDVHGYGPKGEAWTGYEYYYSGDDETPEGTHLVGEAEVWTDSKGRNQRGYKEYTPSPASAAAPARGAGAVRPGRYGVLLRVVLVHGQHSQRVERDGHPAGGA